MKLVILILTSFLFMGCATMAQMAVFDTAMRNPGVRQGAARGYQSYQQPTTFQQPPMFAPAVTQTCRQRTTYSGRVELDCDRW